ncbi:hypothetical protein [Moorena bouillonii]|nr:hypothetical protein [Moorena bouillonii]
MFKKHSFLLLGNLSLDPLFPVPCSLFPIPYYLSDYYRHQK